MLPQKIKETAKFIKSKTHFDGYIGIILGTGLGGLVKEIEIEYSLDYTEIPHFPVSTVESHHGRLIFGKLGGKNIIAMQGRFHYYEGYTMEQVTFPVRVMKALGVNRLMLSNACGSVNKELMKGDLMIIRDHINLLPENPLRGRNYEELGPRFPDMSQPYNRKLIKMAQEIADRNNIGLHSGVYVAVQGPNLETSAEYKYLHIIGADVVGMSTIPEVIVAVHSGIKCFAISVITDEGWHDELHPVTVEEVIEAAGQAEPQMTLIMKDMISAIEEKNI